ncbi:hypothetical protein GGS21DRAFT_534324 [Xylaria nigripes]|nr:hypothetical protein GGS21DRAFT_534324 [Xylaria nigripes]
MADPLLTSLCTICHIQPPRYKCPRCKARTCSLSCVKKHKTWSSCNGERDPTVFIPLTKLKTDAGIDHDYNFLTKIERSVERAERILREDRDILPEGTPDQPLHKKARLGKGQSRGRTTIDNGPRRWDKNALQRMRALGIHVSSVPYGMTRSRENKTSWNRRTKTINWQVEWVIFDTEPSIRISTQTQFKRLLHKALDETPLHVAFTEALEFERQRQLTNHERAEEKAHRKQQLLGKRPQDPKTSMWQDSLCLMQNYTTGSWNGATDTCSLFTAKDKYHFFFLKPKTPSREPRRLMPLEASENLASILPDKEIVEYPTIYVLPAPAVGLGEGYIIEKPDKRQPARKRKASTLVDYESGTESLPEASDEDEDGQIMKQNVEEEMSDDSTSSSGSDTDTSD